MIDPAWILALMLKAEPAAASSPWRESYEATAAAFARAASARPLFAGPDGAAKTGALLVSVAWFESRFQPDARGDCTKGGVVVACATEGAVAHSFCALQVGASNFRALATTQAEVQSSIDACVDAGLRMMRASFAVCRAEPLEHRLAHYAAGGYSCPQHNGAQRKSEHRVAKALWLFRNLPPQS